MADQTYYVEGYIDQGYYEAIIDSGSIGLSGAFTPSITVDIADDTGYFIPDYITDDYFVGGVTQEASASLSASATLTATSTRIKSSTADLDVAATISATGSKLLANSIALSVQVTQTTTVGRIRSFDAGFSGVFSPSITVNATRGGDIDLFTNASFEATVSKFQGTEITLANIANLNAQAAKTMQLASTVDATAVLSASSAVTYTTDSTLSTAFTLTADTSATKPFSSNLSSAFTFDGAYTVEIRQTSVTQNSGGRYTTLDINNSIYKFGGGSLEYDASRALTSIVKPQTNAVYNGTNWVTVGDGHTWTSSDAQTWTRATNNLSIGTTVSLRLLYLDSTYVVFDGSTINYSTNGTTWSTHTVNLPGSQTPVNERSLTFFDNNWYILSHNSGSSTRIYRSSTITGWSSATNVYQRTTAAVTDGAIAVNGSYVYAVYSFVDTDYDTYWLYSTGGSFSETQVANNNTTHAVSNIQYDGSNYYIFARNPSNNNASYWSASSVSGSWTLSSNWQDSYVTGEETTYINSRWFVPDALNVSVGTSLGSLTSIYTKDSYDYDSTTPFFYANNRYVGISQFDGRSYVSTNATSITKYEIADCENLTPYITYSRGDNTDFNDIKTIDFWYRGDGTDFTNGAFEPILSQLVPTDNIDTQDENFVVFAQGQTGGSRKIGVQTSLGLTFSSTTVTSDTWAHIRIAKNGTSGALYINGSRDTTFTFPSTHTNNEPIIVGGRFNAFEASGFKYYIDELLITDELKTNPSSSTHTVPTEEWENLPQDEVDLLLHFNVDVLDDSQFIVDPEADLSAAFTLTATPIAQFGADADLSAVATLSVDAGVFSDSSATLQAQFTTTATADRIRSFASSLNSILTQSSTNEQRIRFFDSTQNAVATLSATAGELKQATVDLDAFVSTLAAVAKIGQVVVALDSAFTQTLTAQKTTDVDSSQLVVATLTSDADRTRDVSVDLDGVASFAVTATLDASVIVDIDAQATVVADLLRIRTSDVDLALQATVVADPAGTLIRTSADLSAAFTQSADAVATLDTSASFAQTATLGVDANIISDTTVAMQNTATLSADFVRTRDVAVALDAFVSTLTAAAKVGDYLVDINTTATLSADAVVLSGNTATLESFAQVSATAGAIRQGASALDTVATLSADPKEIVGFGAVLDAQAALSADPIATVQAQATLDTQAGFSITVRASKSGDIDLFVAANQTADVERIRSVGSTQDLQATLTADVNLNTQTSVNLAGAFSISTTLSKINIDENVYVIPREYRAQLISVETREHQIVRENREYELT